jgi:hypothetical protein
MIVARQRSECDTRSAVGMVRSEAISHDRPTDHLAAVKLTTVQVNKLPLLHKIRNIGMICFVKPVLTEDLCVVQKEDIFNNKLYVRNVHLTKGQAYS